MIWHDLEADVATAVRRALDVTFTFDESEGIIKYAGVVALAIERLPLRLKPPEGAGKAKVCA